MPLTYPGDVLWGCPHMESSNGSDRFRKGSGRRDPQRMVLMKSCPQGMLPSRELSLAQRVGKSQDSWGCPIKGLSQLLMT